MSFAICVLAAIPIRKSPDLLSEMTSQVLFGECYKVLEEEGILQRIQVAHDRYEGWIDGRQGEPIDDATFERARSNTAAEPVPLLEDMAAAATLGDDRLILVRGSSLPAEINGRRLTCEGQTTVPLQSEFSEARIQALAQAYLQAPYHWGGRSPFGIDCSGLVQTLYKFFEIRLLRDSKDQAGQGTVVESLAQARPGDLAFFETVFDHSSHVGLVIEGGVIHASGRVRSDVLSEEGIRIRETKKLTHHLTGLRRVIGTV